MRLVLKIGNRLRREVCHAAARARASLLGTHLSEAEFRRGWEGASSGDVVGEWLAAPPVLFAEDLKPLPEASRVVREADEILAGRIRILGEVNASEPTDFWHRDPVTQEMWPAEAHFTRFSVFHPARDGVTDIRRLWEVGRFGWALPLAQASATTGRPEYAMAWNRWVDSFIAENPPEYGPHWSNAMEVAIRAIQWCRAIALMSRAPGGAFRPSERVLLSLIEHGRYIRRFLEWTPRGRTNHYLADLAGLLCLGVFLPSWREAREWRELARRELEGEMEIQTDGDGFHAEASTAYHHFVVEIYELVAAVDRAHQLGFSGNFQGRLARMREVDHALRGREKLDPRLGDDDSGTLVLPPGLAQGESSTGSRLLRASGIGILRSDLVTCHVACGLNGQQGVGGHAHNDKLSVVLSARGRPLVIDPGTACYSADIVRRDLFRSTAMHNTVKVDGQEQNPLRDWRMLEDRTQARVLRWEDSERETVFEGEHRGYAALGVEHRRTIRLDKRAHRLTVEDVLTGRGEHRAEFHLHLAPEILREQARWEGTRLVLPGATFEFEGTPLPEWFTSFCSPIYGTQRPGLALHWECSFCGEMRFRWSLVAT
jgi:hypothetical protein